MSTSTPLLINMETGLTLIIVTGIMLFFTIFIIYVVMPTNDKSDVI